MARITHDLTQGREWPQFRVYHRTASGQPWLALRTFASYAQNGGPDGRGPVTDARPGVHVRRVSRVLLPAFGEAELDLFAGLISGRRFQTGEDWDLYGHQIRIDALPDGADAATASAYTTVWWGICVRQTDEVKGAAVACYGETDDTYPSAPRAEYPILRRSYHCLDLTYPLQKRYIDRHFYDPGTGATYAVDHPTAGYNITTDGSASAPNRSDSTYVLDGVSVQTHAFPGEYNAQYWDDSQVLAHILAMHSGSAGAQEEVLTVVDSASLLTGFAAWPTPYGTTVHQLMAAICARSRGLGAAYLDWDPGQIDASSDAYIRIVPQLADDLTADAISDSSGAGTAVVITGASSAGTLQDIVIAGDQRLADESFRVGDAAELRVDEVETVGERIQVLASVGKPDGSLEAGWTDTDVTAWQAAGVDAKDRQTFDAVYRRLQIPADWLMQTGDSISDTTGEQRLDYSTGADGSIDTPSKLKAGERGETSPADIRLASFLPCPLSLDPQDASSTATENRDSGQHSWRAWKRTGDNAVEAFDFSAQGYTCHIAGLEIELQPTAPEGSTRASADFWEDLIFTVGIELPDRVRLISLRQGIFVPRSKVIKRVPNAHLWLGHRGAIVDIDTGSTPRRIATAAPVIYRDDRRILQRTHALAVAWYTIERRPASWTLRHCCGLLPDFEDAAGTQDYAQLGQVIGTLTYAGEAERLNTVVSSIIYQDGRTTWTTDWDDLA